METNLFDAQYNVDMDSIDSMDSMQFLFDNRDIGSIDDAICYDNDMILVQNEVIARSNHANESLNDNDFVVNDVFLDHSNAFAISSLFDTGNHDNYDLFNDQKENYLIDECDEWESDDSEMSKTDKFFDDILAEECAQLLAKEPLFGCVCCPSCKTNAAKGIAKLNEVFKHFRLQFGEMKQNFNKQLCDIKSDLFSSLLDCARVILDLQMKLNEKSYDTDNLLDLTQHLSIRNDNLDKQLCDMTLSFENVCKENITLRDKLGLKLKVVIDSDECIRAMNERKQLKMNAQTVSENSVNMSSKLDVSVNLERDITTAKVLICLSDEINALDQKLNKSLSSINNLVRTNVDAITECTEIVSTNDSLPHNSTNRSETEQISSTILNNRDGIRRRIISRPTRYRFDDNYIGRNEERDRPKSVNACNYVNNRSVNGHNTHTRPSTHSSNYQSMITYSKFDSNHKPLISSKSHSVNGFVNNSDRTSMLSSYNDLCMKTLSDLTDQVNQICAKDNTCNNISSINMQSSQCNSYQTDLYSNASDNSHNNSSTQGNGLKLTLKIPKDFKEHGIMENKRYCKHCKTSFPDMSCRQFKDHVYVNCSARNFNKRRVECDKCSRVFLGTSALQSHLRHKNCLKNGVKNKKNRNINKSRILNASSI